MLCDVLIPDGSEKALQVWRDENRCWIDRNYGRGGIDYYIDLDSGQGVIMYI